MTVRADETMDGVTIRPIGGLGNQLFSYACGRAVTARLDCPLYIDVSSFAGQPTDETLRSFELGWLSGHAQVVNYASRRSSFRLLRAAERALPSRLRTSQFHERSFEYDARVLSVTRGTILNGYFQSWRYFETIASELRAELMSAAPVSAWFHDQKSRLDAIAPWIAVHVRRGDYTLAKNAQYHGLLGQGYYQRALTELSERLPNARVVLFSDEPARAIELIEPLHSIDHVVIPPPEAHAMESIALMAIASAVVIANSSFSWWGAWLADPARTAAAAPSPWFSGASLAEEDLCPPQWLRLPHSRIT